MNDTTLGVRSAWGEWRPETPIPSPPICPWPPRPAMGLQWIFRDYGLLLPLSVFWFYLTLVTWVFLGTWAFFTPKYVDMVSVELGWIGWLFAQTLGPMLAVFGSLHVYH